MTVIRPNSISGVTSITAQGDNISFYNSDGVSISQFNVNVNSTSGVSTIANVRVTGVTTVSAGSTSAPSITPTGDSNTGIFFPAADTVAIAEGGTEILRIDSSGNLGIGTNNPTTELEVLGTGTVASFRGKGGSSFIGIRDEDDGTVAFIGVDGGSLKFQTSGSGFSDKIVIDSSGRLLVGTTSARTAFQVSTGFGNVTPVHQFEFNSQTYNGLSITHNTGANTYPAVLAFGKSRGSSAGSYTAVANGDGLGWLDFYGADGTNMVRAATISAEVDGPPGTNDMPGRLIFSTTADGASSPTERMRISSGGIITVTGQTLFSGGDTDAVDIKYNGQRVGFYITQQNASFNNIFRFANSSGRYIDYTLANGTSPTFSITNNAGTGVQLTYGATSWSSVSDIRLKNISGGFKNALNDVAKLEAIKFTWKNDSDKIQQVGLSAQSVQSVLPEAVSSVESTSESGEPTEYLSVRYSEVIPLLVAALQESKQRIETLESELASLKGQ